MGMDTRRDFLKKLAAGAVATPLFLSARARAQEKYDDLRIAFVGTGGICGMHMNEMTRLGVDCPCYCDVDSGRWGGAKERWPNAAAYQDYRIMLEKHADEIDGVMIGTPDHHHFPASVIAMQLGLHTYTQKPLVHTAWEGRQLKELGIAHPELATQMGNQGHASDAWRQLYNYVNAGGIGAVLETHTWTDRATGWWPQGMNRPDGEDPIPANLDWDLWIGPAPMRPFKAQWPQGGNVYHDFVWRGWFDFGTGALGDMGCHMMDGMFWTMDPGYPTLVEPLLVEGITSEAFPAHAIVRWNFPEKDGRPGFQQYWYESGLKPEKPEQLGEDVAWDLPSNGTVWIGSEGVLLFESSGGPIHIWPQEKEAGLNDVPELLPKCPNQDHYAEWLNAIRGTDTTKSNFVYAGGMTETIHLGNIAMRMGQPIEYDGPSMKIPNLPEAEELLSKDYREGWKFH